MELNKAIQIAIEHIEEFGLTDTILEKPKELDYLKIPKFRTYIADQVRNCINDVKNSLKDEFPPEIFAKLKMNRIHYTLLPKKSAFGYRRCAIIEPSDLIKFLTLVIMISDQIEKNRIPSKDKIIFSYRYLLKDKELFDSKYSFGEFIKKYKELRLKSTNKIIVKCDISNFYDRLNLHKLEAILYSIQIEKKIVRILNEILLFWAERNSYGLPVGNNASRILAEASLIEIDKFLLSHNVNYIRFVDDFILFAPDAKTAHYWLSILIERLSEEGLMLNQNKTEIIANDFNTNDIEEDKKSKNKIIEEIEQELDIYDGYGGEVPLKFVNIANKKKKQIRKLNEENILEKLQTNLIIKPDDFIDLCEAINVKKKYDLAIQLPILLEKFPQLTAYTIDFLIFSASQLSKADKVKIRELFEKNWFKQLEKLPEYILGPLIRLFANKHYENKTLLIKIFRELPTSKGVYIRRILLDSLYSLIDRGNAKEIQSSYSKGSFWEKRQIISISRKYFEQGELRAMFKNIKAENNEEFIDGMIMV